MKISTMIFVRYSLGMALVGLYFTMLRYYVLSLEIKKIRNFNERKKVASYIGTVYLQA